MTWTEVSYDDDTKTLGSRYTPKRFRVFFPAILSIFFACVAIMVVSGNNVLVGIDSTGISSGTFFILLSIFALIVSIYVFIRPSRYKIGLALITICSMLSITAYFCLK